LSTRSDGTKIGFEYRNAEPLRPCFNDGGKRMSFKERIESFEAERIESVLVRCGGDRPHAAQRLQIQKRTLDSKIEAYGLQTAE